MDRLDLVPERLERLDRALVLLLGQRRAPVREVVSGPTKAKRAGVCGRIDVVAGLLEQRADSPAAFEGIVRRPVHLEHPQELQPSGRLPCLDGPVERDVDVRTLLLRKLHRRAARALWTEVRALERVGEHVQQPAHELVPPLRVEVLARELADRLEDEEAARADPPDEALVDE